MHVDTHLGIDSVDERIHSDARQLESIQVHVCQKVRRSDVEPEESRFCNSVEHCMNLFHWNICNERRVDEKEADETFEATLNKIWKITTEYFGLKLIGRIGFSPLDNYEMITKTENFVWTL